MDGISLPLQRVIIIVLLVNNTNNGVKARKRNRILAIPKKAIQSMAKQDMPIKF